MASQDGGDSDAGEQRNTRFPCLATMRTSVATVVTVLAAVVVLMVILAVNRPQKIIIYMEDGYIQADPMWWKEKQVQTCGRGEGRRPIDVLPIGGDNPRLGDDNDCEDGGNITVYYPADKVLLWLSVSAYNPNGRGKTIVCNITAIRVLDVNSSYAGVAIGSLVYPADDPIRSAVPPQTSHSKGRRINISDADALQYLYRRYQQITSFRTMVQVDVAYSKKTGNISFYCYPVTLGYGTPTTKPDGVTVCKTTKEIAGYNISWYPPPPTMGAAH